MHKVASFTKDRKPLKGKSTEQANLEYCFDLPTKWKQYINPPMDVCFSGWAISLDKSQINIMITEEGCPSQTIQPKVFRPDVKEVLETLGKNVDSRCGFEFSLNFDELTVGEKKFTIEISNDNYSSGPIEFTVRSPSVKELEETLEEQKRENYKSTWNVMSKNEDEAKIAVSGSKNEEGFTRSAEFSKSVLLKTVGVDKDDVVLEIGCGVARMAPVLAPICKKWIGTDVSENMLKYAQQRTIHLPNVEFVPIDGWDLHPISDQSVDLVYCTVVFMHIDEWERYNYICEAKRILRPGGRLYVDNFNLRSDEGWKIFMQSLLDFHPMKRPPHISKSSTPDELQIYFERAGFTEIHQSESERWILTWGVKP